MRGRHPSVIKSAKALNYELVSDLQLRIQLVKHATFTDYVRLTVDVYYASKRPDLDVSLLQDVLEKAGVYNNDRQIVECHAKKYWDKLNPRCEILIEEIGAL